MPSSTTAYVPRSTRKPQGGFVFLTVQQLCLLWWAYRARLIQLRDFRVWFAAQEMTARRCQLASEHVAAYTHKELHGLVGGVGGEHLRASLRRLEALGLLTWSRTTLALPPHQQTSKASRISPDSSRCTRPFPTTADAYLSRVKPYA